MIKSDLKRFEVYSNRLALGNLGLSEQELFFNNSSELGFNYSKNSYSNNYFSQKQFKYYDTRTPFSDVFYVAGSKKEQFFKMTFSYNVKKNWNVTVDFKKLRSVGFYLRQNVGQSYVALSSNYKSRNNRYYAFGNIIYNSPNHIENGGIADDSVFESEVGISKNALAVNLISARKKISNRGIYLKQYLNFGRKSSDTIQKSIIPSSSFVLTTGYLEDRYKYTDENPEVGYYDQIYRDSLTTNDSSRVVTFDNEIEWRRWDNKKQRGIVDWFGFNLKARNQLIRIQQFEIDTAFSNLIIGGGFYNTYTKKSFWYSANLDYCLRGYNKEDYRGYMELKKGVFGNKIQLSVFYLSEKKSPDYIYTNYLSNHFVWNNNFLQTETNSIGGRIHSVKYDFDLGVDYSTKKNVIYFDHYANPKQYWGEIPVLKVSLRKDIEFFGFHLDNRVVYQNVPDSVVIRLPEFVLNHSLYYETPMFKNALTLQVGASLFWFSEFYGNTYMPATSQFYLQSERKIGNYPFVDFFVNTQIKTVRIFFKIDHLNSGISGSNYFAANHYPINDRAFKFGISWRFFD